MLLYVGNTIWGFSRSHICTLKFRMTSERALFKEKSEVTKFGVPVLCYFCSPTACWKTRGKKPEALPQETCNLLTPSCLDAIEQCLVANCDDLFNSIKTYFYSHWRHKQQPNTVIKNNHSCCVVAHQEHFEPQLLCWNDKSCDRWKKQPRVDSKVLCIEHHWCTGQAEDNITPSKNFQIKLAIGKADIWDTRHKGCKLQRLGMRPF